MPTKPVRRDLLGHHPEGFRHRGHAAGRGLGQLEPVVVLAGPHLHKLSDEGPAPAVKAVPHGALHAVFSNWLLIRSPRRHGRGASPEP